MLLSNLSDYALGNISVTESEFPTLPAGFLSSMCEVEDRRPQLSRLSEDSEYVHVSSLLELCPRQYAIARTNKIHLTNTVSSSMRLVWEIGKSLEKYVIGNIKTYHGEDFVHDGINIVNDEYMIMGAPDIVVGVSETSSVIVECKTMNIRDFEKLERPIGDHVLQAALYKWLYNEYYEHTTAHDNVILLYIAKDFARGSPYKEFHIDTTQTTVSRGVELCLDLAAELKRAREADRIPHRHICDRQDCTRAKNCPVAHLCFSLPEQGT